MTLDKIVFLAAHLGAVPLYIGYGDEDTQINIPGFQSQAFETPAEAFAEARRVVETTGRTGLSYGVRVEIGDDVIVTCVEGFSGKT